MSLFTLPRQSTVRQRFQVPRVLRRPLLWLVLASLIARTVFYVLYGPSLPPTAGPRLLELAGYTEDVYVMAWIVVAAVRRR